MNREMIRGMIAFVCGGMLAFAFIVLIQYLLGLISRALIYFRMDKKKEADVVPFRKEPHNQKMESFAYAVNGLSDAFFAMSQPKVRTLREEVTIDSTS